MYRAPSDYAWLPVMGIVTVKSLQLLDESKNRTLRMKDGSTLYFYTLAEYSNVSLHWVVENPGKQMFTGSFHPINDKLWEDRRNWDSRVAPTMGVTMKEIFTQHIVIQTAKLRNKALKILSKFTPYLGQDSVKNIALYLRDCDLGNLCSVCKVDATEKRSEKVTSLEIPPLEEFSPYIGTALPEYFLDIQNILLLCPFLVSILTYFLAFLNLFLNLDVSLIFFILIFFFHFFEFKILLAFFMHFTF
jgi:hypothetical protein